ncbi:hypothetical protein D3C86_1334670 [compost metagenome]
MQDHRQTVDGDHLFAFGTLQVAKAGQAGGFAVLDRARGSGQLGAVVVQSDEPGARTVGSDGDVDQATLVVTRGDTLLVLAAVLDAHIGETVLLQHAADQRRPQLGADGVGTLQAQGRLAVGGQGQGGEAAERSGNGQQPAEQQTGSERQTAGGAQHGGREPCWSGLKMPRRLSQCDDRSVTRLPRKCELVHASSSHIGAWSEGLSMPRRS